MTQGIALRNCALSALVGIVLLASAFSSTRPLIPLTQGPDEEANRYTHVAHSLAPVLQSVHVARLTDFVSQIANGHADTLVGIYVPQRFAFSIAQQPPNQPGYVLPLPAVVTQFEMARSFAVTGLLAHNSLAGAAFFGLAIGDEADLVRGDGTLQRYSIKAIRHLHALSPTDPYSEFQDMDRGGRLVSAAELFAEVYTESGRLVLQTCIAANGDPLWGRLFVIGTPISSS